MKKLSILLILFISLSIYPRKLYVDFAGGADASLGTSTGAAWKHHPYMQGWTGSYTHAVGDSFILKGGVTWPNACFPMNIATGGSSTPRDYYGIDKTWYTGGSWARPIFDMQGSQTASTNRVLNLTIDAASNIYFDKIEITGFYWSGAQSWGNGVIVFYTRNKNLTFDSLYIHSWSHDTYANGTLDGMHVFLGYTSNPGDSNITIENCEMSGLPNGTTSGIGIYGGCSCVQNCLIHDMANGLIVIPGGTLAINSIVHNNTMYNLNESYDPTQHMNGYYIMGAGYCYNNILHDVIGAGVMPYYISPGFGGTSEDNIYFYNNIAYNISSNNAGMVIDCESGNYSGTVYVLNNICTGNNSGTGACLTVVARATDTVNAAFIQNNHWITTSGSPVLYNSMPSYGMIKTVTINHNLTMTPTTATTQGYIAGNNYAPTSGSNSTVDAGTSEAALSPVDTADILGVHRPQGAGWDIGPYEYVRKFYIDYVGGADASLGTSKGAAWQHHPYMQGWTGSYTHAVGDTFIFKGGVTWPNACFMMTVGAGGSLTHPDYYGEDKTWYTGGSWTRPVFNCNGTVATSAYAFKPMIWIDNQKNIIFHNIEFDSLYVNTSQLGTSTFYLSNDDSIVLRNCYIHDWQMKSDLATDNMFGGIIGNNATTAYGCSNWIDSCVISDSCNGGLYNGFGARNISIVTATTFHHIPNAVLGTTRIFQNCVIRNAQHSFDSTEHCNCFETFQWNNIGNGLFTGNKIYNVPATHYTLELMNVGPADTTGNNYVCTLHVWNNVIINSQDQTVGIKIDPAGGITDTLRIAKMWVDCFNNTLDSCVITAVDRSSQHVWKISKILLRNNHFIGATTPVSCNYQVTLDSANQLLQTASVAAAQGYTPANKYAPAVGGSTIDAGVSEAAYFTTDILGITRPQGSAWDIGAYEYASGISLSLSYPTTVTHRGSLTTITPTITGSYSQILTINGLPAGLSISSSTGVISGTPTVKKTATPYMIGIEP
jgi:hypothetical protein